MSTTDEILERVAQERQRQREQWGDDHDDHHTHWEWTVLLTKWVGQVAVEIVNPLGATITQGTLAHSGILRRLRDLYIKVAAIAVAAAEATDRKLNPPFDEDTEPDDHHDGDKYIDGEEDG